MFLSISENVPSLSIADEIHGLAGNALPTHSSSMFSLQYVPSFHDGKRDSFFTIHFLEFNGPISIDDVLARSDAGGNAEPA